MSPHKQKLLALLDELQVMSMNLCSARQYVTEAEEALQRNQQEASSSVAEYAAMLEGFEQHQAWVFSQVVALKTQVMELCHE